MTTSEIPNGKARISHVVGAAPSSGQTPARFNILIAAAGTVTTDTGPQSSLVDLSSFLGMTVEVAFEWTIPEPGGGPAQFQLDNICLKPKPIIPCDGFVSFFDLIDHANFVSCLLGPGIDSAAGCDCFDSDGDGSVTLRDFADFQVDFGN